MEPEAVAPSLKVPTEILRIIDASGWYQRKLFAAQRSSCRSSISPTGKTLLKSRIVNQINTGDFIVYPTYRDSIANRMLCL